LPRVLPCPKTHPSVAKGLCALSTSPPELPAYLCPHASTGGKRSQTFAYPKPTMLISPAKPYACAASTVCLKGRMLVGRPLAIWVLALVAVIAGLVTLVITLQFLEIIPWVGDEAEFWGGKWAGVFLYGLETFLFFAVAFGWLTLKPWAP